VEARKLISNGTKPGTVEELNNALGSVEKGVHPEDIWSLGEKLGFAADIRYSENGSTGCCDVVLRKEADRSGIVPCRHAPLRKQTDEYGNNPANKLSTQNFAADLRKYLSGTLPDYMIPAAFVVLDDLPLTPNGKVDRLALPAPDTSTFTGDRVYDPPTNEEEMTLTEIWSRVLRLDKVGINDDVFELGGDSLLIFQIVTRATQSGLRITPKQVFENRTIAGIVKSLSRDEKPLEKIAGPSIARVSREANRVKRSALEGVKY
jgi:hypothetical protein